MADVLRDLKTATVEICLVSQACVGAAVIEGDNGASIGISVADWNAGTTSQFDGSKPGLKDDGTIIGTNPALGQGAGSST